MKSILLILLSTGIILQANTQTISHLESNIGAEFVAEYLELINKGQVQPSTPTIGLDGPKQKMDSSVTQIFNGINWLNTTKEYYIYDELERETSRITYNWNSTTDSWVPSEKIAKGYSSGRNMSFFYHQKWNANLLVWLPIALEEYTYDQSDNVVSKTAYRTWNHVTKKWKNGYRYAYYYTNGNLTEEISSEVDLATGLWKFKSVDKYSLNLNNMPTTKQTLEWDETTGKFVPKLLDENNYFNNQLTRTVRHIWAAGWRPIAQINYDFGNDGLLDQMSLLLWSSAANSWQLRRKNVIDYNVMGVLIENQTYMNIAGNWVGTSMYNKDFDLEGNFNRLTVFDWNPASGYWNFDRKSTSNFDYSVTSSQLITPFPVDEFKHKKTVDSSFVWNAFYMDWAVNERKFYHYSYINLISTETENIEAETTAAEVTESLAYPNPVNEVLNFNHKLSDQQVMGYFYSLDGKLVFLSQIKSKQVNLSHLVAGTYIYRLIDGVNQYSGKIIKQ